MSKLVARVSLVTGGTQGIGRAVAVALARRGDRVLFVGRDAQRGESVLRELFKVAPGGEHVFIRADLSLLSETARVAQRVRELTSTLDAVIFCAGILSTVPEWTEEGLERNFVLNYLTRHLLVIRLLPLLLAAPSGRLVLVANAGRYGDTLDFDDLGHRRGRRGLHVAGRTQFANDLLATELAERTRGSQLEVTCVFPGVARTNLFENSRGIPWVLRLLARFVQLFALSPEQAAQTPVFLASDPEATKLSGRFYGPNNKQLPGPGESAARRSSSATLASQRGARYAIPGGGAAGTPRRGRPMSPSFGKGASAALAARYSSRMDSLRLRVRRSATCADRSLGDDFRARLLPRGA